MNNPNGYLLGIDLGSSSVKTSLIAVDTGQPITSSQSPHGEMPMIAARAGWAEQDPANWWEHVVKSTRSCLQQSGVNGDAVLSVGIAYQMHGLVAVDKNLSPLRPSI